jgi:hypothetical protein
VALGGTAGAVEGELTADFGAKFTAGAGVGPGGSGSGFTIVFGVAAGGLAPGGGVPKPVAFPLRGVVGTPDEGIAMLGATGSGFAPGGAVTVAGRHRRLRCSPRPCSGRQDRSARSPSVRHSEAGYRTLRFCNRLATGERARDAVPRPGTEVAQ